MSSFKKSWENVARIRIGNLKIHYIRPLPNPTDYPFTRAFQYFSKFGNSNSNGSFITYEQSNVWLAEAYVLDGKDVTFQDVALCFHQLGTKLSLAFYNIFLYNLSKRVGIRYSTIMKKMTTVKYPNGIIVKNGVMRKLENCFCGLCALYLKMKVKPQSCIEELRCLFTAFAKFGKSKSEGIYINLSQIDKWMRQARVFDKKIITTADSAIYFKKMRKMMIDFAEFNKFLDELSRSKGIDVNTLKQILWRSNRPECNGVGAVDYPNILKALKSRFLRRQSTYVILKEE